MTLVHRPAVVLPQEAQSTSTTNRANLRLFASFATMACVFGALVLLSAHDSREVESLGLLLLKLLPFLFGLLAIAVFPIRGNPMLNVACVAAAFFLFFCYLVPRAFFLAGDDWTAFYLNMQVMVPYVILFVVLAYRLGGASVKNTLTAGVTMILLMLSGVEDLAFWIVNRPDVGPIPETWTAASHMTVFVGRPLSKYEAYVFIGVHLVIIAVTLHVSMSSMAAPLRRNVARCVGAIDLS